MADKNSPGTSPHTEPGGRDPAGTPNQNPESDGATSNPRKVGLANLGVSLTSPSSDSLLTELNSQAAKTRKSSFQITRVVDTVGLTDVDSLDDLDEGTNTEMDRSSESREASKLTGEMISDQYDTVTTTVDTLRSPSPGGLESLSVAGEKLTSSPQNEANSSLPSSVRRSSPSSSAHDKPQTLTPQSDIQSRFKIVKIINNVRGRWTCLDFSGPPANDTTSNDSKCSSTLGSRSASAVNVTKPILYVANNPTTANETLVCGADGTLVHLQNISEFIKTLPEQVNSASSLTPDTIAKVLGALNAQHGGGMVNGNVEINPSLLSNVVPQTRSLVPSSSHIISTTFAEESREYDSNEILLTGIRSKSDPVFVVDTGDVKLAGAQEENGSSVVLRRNESTGAVDTVQDSAEYTDSASAISALDDKIEQAMDLVKSHLMFAVHEEVEVLKDQIKELMIKNTQLEMENHLLRAAATTVTLAKIDGTQPSPTTKTDFT